ncbi:MAG TPA: hypothetical protein VG944_23965, partial [Fimbriimonas sp.]|nr:hypothetical protein [Fimbriimonas sp.]
MHSRVLGVLAGDRLKPEWLRPWVDSADVVIAADAGADFVVAADRVPAVLVGDLDSVSEKTRQIVPLVAEHQEQESSDCDKLLAHVRSMGSESVTLCGAEGRRIDHMVATLGSAARSDLRVTIAYEEMIAYVLRGPVDIRLAHQGLVSLLP